MDEDIRGNRQIGLIKANQLIRWGSCFYFFITFFEPYLNGVLGAVTKYYMFILMGLICMLNKKLYKFKFQGCYIAWFAYKVLSMLWSSNLYMPELHMISHIGMIAMLVVLTGMPKDEEMITAIVKTMWVGSAMIGLLSLRFSHPYRGVVATRQVLYLFGQEADPNNQAAFLLTGIAISLNYAMVEKKHRILSVIVILINVYSMFLTGSRGGLVGLACIVLIFYLSVTRAVKVSKRISILVAMLALTAIGYLITIRFLSKDIFQRLFTFSSYEGGSERDIIWNSGFELLLTPPNFLVGAGWGSYFGYNGHYVVMHNTFLSMLCDVGLLGVILFFAPIIMACKALYRKNEILPMLLIVSSFVPSFFIEAINKRFFWNSIFVLFVYYVSHIVLTEKPISKQATSNESMR